MTAMRKINYFDGFSNESDHTIFNIEEDFGAHHYERINLVVRHAKGCWLTDDKEKRYLDCLAAYSAANPGHGPPSPMRSWTPSSGIMPRSSQMWFLPIPWGFSCPKPPSLLPRWDLYLETTAIRCCTKTVVLSPLKPPSKPCDIIDSKQRVPQTGNRKSLFLTIISMTGLFPWFPFLPAKNTMRALAP